MSDAEQRPPPTVPSASRIGTALGWVLLVMGVVCVIASLVIGIRAESAWRSTLTLPLDPESAYTTFVAAERAYDAATVRAYLSMIAGGSCLFVVPGLLYAARPSLLGGPEGQLLRWASAKLAPRYPERKHPVTFFQGLGWALPGVGLTAFSLTAIVTTLTPANSAGLWLGLLGPMLNIVAIILSIPLSGGTWWFTTGKRDTSTGIGDRRIEGAQGDG